MDLTGKIHLMDSTKKEERVQDSTNQGEFLAKQEQAGSDKINPSKSDNYRPFLLITLAHAETRNISEKEVLERVLKCFGCTAIVVAKETHQDNGFHFHIAVHTKDASRYTASKKIRAIFTQFEGRQCDVQFKKAWAPMCAYVTKENKEPLVWGQYNLKQILQAAEAHQKHKKAEDTLERAQAIFNRLQRCKEWIDIYEDPILIKEALRSHSNLRSIFDDLNIVKDKKITVAERIFKFILEHGEPEEYQIEEIKEKYVILDWIACQLCFGRPIKTKQLFIYGKPSTQKTLLFNMLAKALNIYFASSRKNDFSGAHNYYDLWVFDEFHEPEEQSGLYASTETGSTYSNTLLKMLDGQECRLDSKYSRIFTKKANVPIIMIANNLPLSIREKGPFKERFLSIKCQNNIDNLSEERIIATLWGCIQRRFQMKATYAGETDINMSYNHFEGKFYLNYFEQSRGKIEQEKNSLRFREGWAIRRTGETLELNELNEKKPFHQPDNKQEIEIENEIRTIFMHIDEKEFMNKEKLTTIDFAVIPLAKRKCKNKEEPTLNQNEKTGEETKLTLAFPAYGQKRAWFLVFRRKNEDFLDYATWPLNMKYVMHKDHRSPSGEDNFWNLDMNFWVLQKMKIDEEDEDKERIRKKAEKLLKVEGEEGKRVKEFRVYPGGTDEGT